MNTELINYPEKLCIKISGQFRKPDKTSWVFQKSHGGQQKKTGPIIPDNPQSQKQQLCRIHFLSVHLACKQLSPEARAYYASLIKKHQRQRDWRIEYMSRTLKNHGFNRQHFGEGCFRGVSPARPAFRFGGLVFGDGFYARHGDVPANLAAIAAAYPKINIDKL